MGWLNHKKNMNEGWLLIAQFLRPIDLCHMMQLSQNHFHLWVVDRMWMHQRKRMCARVPQLASVFDDYAGNSEEHIDKKSIKKNQNKKRKKAWATPRTGIWYTFKRWLSAGFTLSGLRDICERPIAHPVIMAMMLIHIPPEYAKHVKNLTYNDKWHDYFVVHFARGQLIFNRSRSKRDCTLFITDGVLGPKRCPSLLGWEYYQRNPPLFDNWIDLVLQDNYNNNWPPDITEYMNKII